MVSEVAIAPDDSVNLRTGADAATGTGEAALLPPMDERRGRRLLSAMLAGCVSSGSADVRTPLSPTVARMRSAVVRVTSTVRNSEEATQELEGAIVEQLRQRRAFERVYSGIAAPDRRADVSVDARVVQFTGVSELARGLVGAFAGQAVIVADVELRGTDGEVLGAAKVEGRSSAGTAFAGTTMQAVQRAAEQVADFVTRK